MYINSPTIRHAGTRILVFSDGSEVAYQDMMLSDVAILIKNDYFFIVRDRYKEPWKEKLPIYLLGKTLDYYHEQIKLRLQNNF